MHTIVIQSYLRESGRLRIVLHPQGVASSSSREASSEGPSALSRLNPLATGVGPR
jgi:hypothetical protein